MGLELTRKLFLILIALSFHGTIQATQTIRGLCTTDGSVPGLPKAVCAFPSCPSGGDCQPPSIDKNNPFIDYFEPLLRWQDSCTGEGLSGPCWEVYIDFRLRLAATDSAGINQIGAHMWAESNTKRTFKRYWGAATVKDSYGRYDMTATIIAHVPPGQRLELGVYELCAKDKNGNAGCVEPSKSRNLSYRLSR